MQHLVGCLSDSFSIAFREIVQGGVTGIPGESACRRQGARPHMIWTQRLEVIDEHDEGIPCGGAGRLHRGRRPCRCAGHAATGAARRRSADARPYWAWRSRPGRGSWRRDISGAATAAGRSELIARGKPLYVTNCSACHGIDLRGGVTGGPNLLRSEVVLMDEHGELILPIVRGARAERGMPALPMPDADVFAIAEYIHSILATARGQGLHPRAMRRCPTRSLAMRSREKSTSLRSAPVATPRPATSPGSARESPRQRRCRTTGLSAAGEAGAAVVAPLREPRRPIGAG